MNINDIFPYNIDPNTISVYVGRVIKLDENFEDNGTLFVDLCDPNGTDLDKGAETANIATASFAVRNTHKCWQSPPEILSKTNFKGAMTATMSGDFHLQNYCFDMQSITWFATVSAALNALGIVNIPPVMMSMDQTPFPGKAVSINLASALEEFINELLDAFLREIESDDGLSNVFDVPPLEEVTKHIVFNEDPNDPVTEIIKNITDPLKEIAGTVLKPYYTFLECISLTFQLVVTRVSDVLDWTFPVTSFSDSTTEDVLAVRNKIGDKLTVLEDYISEYIPVVSLSSPLEKVVEACYNPIAYLYTELNNQIANIVEPVKKKLVEVINSYIRKPLLKIANTIAMSIQPIVASLPTIVQLVVKYAIKALLRTLLGSPIKAILVGIADSIKDIIHSIVESVGNKLTSFVTSLISSLTNPIIKEIQSLFYSIIPTHNIDQMKSLLESFLTDYDVSEPLPLKLYVEGALDAPKAFEDINWSDPKDIVAFILALIELIQVASSDPSDLMQEVEIKEIFVPKNAIQPIGSSLYNISGTAFSVKSIDEDSGNYSSAKTIGLGAIVEEGKVTLLDATTYNTTLFFENYDTKNDFLPTFERTHKKATRLMELKDSDEDPNYPFIKSKLEIKTWITNNVTYVETEIEGETQRYIVSEIAMSIPVKKVKSGDSYILEYINIEPNKVYLTQTIQHLSLDTDENVGEDLIPQYTEEGGSRTPTQLELAKVNDKGEILYTLGFRYPSNTEEQVQYEEDDELTFQEIADLYYCGLSDTSYEERDLLKEFIDKIYAILEADSERQITTITLDEVKDTVLIKCFVEGRTVIKDKDDVSRKITDNHPADTELILNEITVVEEGVSVKKLQITIMTRKKTSLTPLIKTNEETDFQAIFLLNKKGDKYTVSGYTKKYYLPIAVNPMLPNDLEYYEDNKSVVSWVATEIVRDHYASWVVSYLGEIKFVMPEPDERKMTMVNMMADLFTHTLNAISQDNFDASFLVNALLSKLTSAFDKISNVVDEIKSRIQDMLSLIEGFNKLDSILSQISSISSTIDKIANTIEPALKATAQAASAVAIQSCSMTQSATGKDFTFNSGDNYDLSTTTTAKAQLPYCKELGREQFLEPNCKALVLAIGAGKQNLFVVDVLS